MLIATSCVVQPVAASAATRDQTPSVPSVLSTSPMSSCQGNTILGLGDVTLYAGVSDPDGGTLGVDFRVSVHGVEDDVVADTDPSKLIAASGTTAVYRLSRATLEAAAASKITEFDWKVRTTDFTHTSGWSTTCHFSFDPTLPGTPSIAQPGTTTVGTPVSITISAPTGGTVPTGYRYQLNVAAPVDVPADASGNATITVTPIDEVNTLTVTSLSAGGNSGGSVSVQFVSAEPPADLTDGDLTRDGVPDLLTVGAQNGLPPGIWLAPGTGNGHVSTSPTDIGIAGNGFNTGGGPSDFDGATVIGGRFFDGPNQDVLVYYPAGIHAGGGLIIKGNGTSAPLDRATGEVNLTSAFQDFNGDNPIQLANAGNTSGSTTGFPDLIGIQGDSTNGYALDLYPSGPVVGNYQYPVALNVKSPDGTTDWTDWTIATTQIPTSGGGTGTALFLWKKSTGELDLWTNLAANADTGALTYNAYPVATGWNTGAEVTLQAADINSDGTPDLWTVGSGEAVTANLFSDLSTTGPATLARISDTLNATG